MPRHRRLKSLFVTRNHRGPKNAIESGAKHSLFSCLAGNIRDCHPAFRGLSLLAIVNVQYTPLLTEEFTLIRRGRRVVRFTGCDSPCEYLSFYTVQTITWEDSPQAFQQVFCRKFRHSGPGFYRSASQVRQKKHVIQFQ